MENSDKNQIVSNERYYFSPYSIGALLLEKELTEHNIQFVKDFVTTRQSYVAYSFFEKDIEFVESILAKIEKESNEHEEKQKKIKKQQKTTPEVRQKKIAIYILIIILLVVIFSIIL